MKEIVNRLRENRQVELAKSILESNGYKVSNGKRLKESKYFAIYSADGESGMSEEDCYPVDIVIANSEEEAIKQYKGEYSNPRSHVFYSASEVSKEEYEDWQRELDDMHDDWQSGHRDSIKDFSGKEYDEIPFKESEAPHRGYKSTREEKVKYAKELLVKAREDADLNAAWELVDFLWDTELLSEIKEVK